MNLPERLAAAIDAAEANAGVLLDSARTGRVDALARQVLRAADVDLRVLARYGFEEDDLRPRVLLDLAERYGVNP